MALLMESMGRLQETCQRTARDAHGLSIAMAAAQLPSAREATRRFSTDMDNEGWAITRRMIATHRQGVPWRVIAREHTTGGVGQDEELTLGLTCCQHTYPTFADFMAHRRTHREG
jgi:hypothetical protein